LVDEEGVTVAASNSTPGAVLRRLAIGGSAAVLGALLFCVGPAGASTAGHASSAQATAHRHPSSHDKQAAERAVKQAAERAKRAAQAKAKAEHARAEHAKAEHAKGEHAKAEHAKAEHAKAEHAKARQQAVAERQASQAAAEAATAAAKAQAAVTKALRKAGLPAGGDQPTTPASTGKPAVLTASTGQQLAAAASASKANTAKLASSALRQAAAVGSVFNTGNSAPASKQSAPASKPVRHPAAAKHAQPRTTQAAPPARLIQIQTPIRLAEAAGLSLGAGPLVLLGLVVVGGLATVIAGTRRRSSAQRG
jgi:hypothetical protein